MTWTELLKQAETLESGLEAMPAFGHYEATKHYARIDLANALALAREILEALANDEEEHEEASE